MQEQQKIPDTDEVNGHPHYELFAGLRHICHDMQVLHVGFEVTRELFEILDNIPQHAQPLDEATLRSIQDVRWAFPFIRLDDQVKNALWSLVSARHHIEGHFEGEPKIEIEDRLQRIVAETAELKQECERLRNAMLNASQPYLIRQANLDSLRLVSRPIVVQITDLLHSTTPKGVGQELYDRLNKHAALLRGVMAALAKWRDNPSQNMAKVFTRCYANWVSTYRDLGAMAEEAEQECRKSGLRYMTRFGYKLTRAEYRRLQLPANTPIK
jgi:hypothetical protein